METLGIDVGYSFVKTSTQMIFPSRITQAEPLLGLRKADRTGCAREEKDPALAGFILFTP